MPAKPRGPMLVYRLRVELLDIKPLIWRRLLVPADIKLPKLHQCLQLTMGWTNSHLHQFKVGETHYGIPDPEWPELEMLDERRILLCDLIGEAQREIGYEYDFGDGWEHRIVLEQVDPPNEFMRYPLCTAGERACPPEDVGGVPGYEEFLKTIRDPEHEEYDQSLLWAGGGAFDPEGFDLNAVNRALGRVRL
jgi:pRiA4b ORF-3-like protein